ncbi:MAG TPA: glycosyltransferase family 9 protein [Woeseiaceae bacterium]|nr:glycosyltransferase family 9 protein [Woeseiaceae bacterium]
MSSRSPFKRFAKRAERTAGNLFKHLIRRLVAAANPIPVEKALASRRILLIRPNFRIGNAAISTSLIACFRARFPEARIDFLGTDSTRAVLLHQPVDVCYTVSRRQLLRPWQYVSLVRSLRRNRYDLAVQAGSGSLTGTLVVRLVGARYTMGRGEDNRRQYHLEVSGEQHHAYDNALSFARALGSSCPDHPIVRLGSAERENALELLRASLGTPLAPQDDGFVALSLGGRGGKRWPLENWLTLIRILEEHAHRFAVFLGPEERGLEGRLREAMMKYRHGTVLGPRPLREFCAMLSFARCLVTPDSGPMHLAAGLEVPTIALLRNRISLAYAPRGKHDTTLFNPGPGQVHAALIRNFTARRQRTTGPALLAKDSGRRRL